MAIKRNEVFIVPNGATKLKAGDRLYLLAEEKNALVELQHNLDQKKQV